MFLAPEAIYPGIPAEFAYPAAFGDLVAALLAIVTILALAAGARRAKALTWVFNVWGSVDLVTAIALATIYDVGPFMGPAY